MDWPLFNTGMTETWREGRKLVEHTLRPTAMMIYGRMIQEKRCEFLIQLLEAPKNFRTHVKLSVGDLSYYRMTINDRTAFREKLSCHSLMATT